MAITKSKDPRTRKEITIAEGVVEKVYINPLKQVKTYAGKNGPWTPTHTINIVVDGDRISLGLTEKEQLRCKDVDGKYHDVLPGAEISVLIDDESEYNGKPQYSAKASGVTILAPAPVGAQPTPQKPVQGASSGPVAPSNGSGWKKDTTGVEVGHALTIASQILGDVSDADAVLDLAKDIHVASIKLKAWYKDQNKGLSDYDIGATSGQAMKLVAKASMSVNDVVSGAKKFLTEVVPALTTYVKGEEPEQIKPEPKAQAKPAPKAAPKPQPKVVEPETDFGDDDDDFDDQVPF